MTVKCACRLIVLVWLMVSGCQSQPPEKHSGNLAACILEQAAAYGGRINSRHPPAPIEARWICETDKNRVIIQVFDGHFAEVEALLASVFGAPRTAVHQRADGCRGGGYWIGDIGVAINFYEDAAGCTIAFINPRY